MSVTYTDQVRPAAARVDSEAYVPVYARSGARKSNKPLKTWMILAPLGVLVLGERLSTAAISRTLWFCCSRLAMVTRSSTS